VTVASERPALTWPTTVDVREVGPRDGLQIEQPLPTADKRRLMDALVATGVGRIEATAFVSPRAVPAMADAAEIGAYVRSRGGGGGSAAGAVASPLFSALVASPNGARRAVEAGFTMIEYVVSAADGHSRANARRSTDEAVAAVAEVAEVVHAAGGRLEVIIATAWDCPFDGPTPLRRTVEVARRCVELGADQLCLGDTIGSTSPARVVAAVEAVRDVSGGRPLGAHFHNTRGMGIAKELAAV
jgi:hydroxymethylglutaryl-CoA lyase